MRPSADQLLEHNFVREAAPPADLERRLADHATHRKALPIQPAVPEALQTLPRWEFGATAAGSGPGANKVHVIPQTSPCSATIRLADVCGCFPVLEKTVPLAGESWCVLDMQTP